MNVLSSLKAIKDFEGVPDEQLQWLAANGEVVNLREGDQLFKPGDPIDRLLIVLKGSVVLKIQQGNQYRVVSTFTRHDITGWLPYSRADKSRGYAIATLPSMVFKLHKRLFREMILHQEELTAALVHTMSSRIRQFTRFEQQNEKMMALGKLSAGLAHELNNPSAAIIRSVQSLGRRIRLLPENFKQALKIQPADKQIDGINRLLMERLHHRESSMSMMERTSFEDELIDLLEEFDLDNVEEVAANMVAFGFRPEDLEELHARVNEEDIPAIISWIDQLLAAQRLTDEIADASNRIHKLISSVKGYTHMDQAPEKQAVDIHEGLESTITMLNHKINKAGIAVDRQYEPALKKPEVLVSEINQVWTNLIDNAIDAMGQSDERTLTIRTTQDGEYVYVHIHDTGSGIPEEVQGHVFDPFFTTKPVGKGTGLGMELVRHIVDQHNGSVSFESRPGDTEFRVCLPAV